MKKHHVLAAALFCATSFSYSQCDEIEEQKVLLVGDSWAFFMNADQTFNDVFDHWGFSNYNYEANLTLTVNGAQTEDFLEEERLNEIESKLNEFPSIDIVHLSITGNDFLGDWNVDFTEEETQELSDETFGELLELTEFIKGVRPDIEIMFSGYQYANFAEVIDAASPFEESHPFYDTWEEMGFPTFAQLNTLLNDFSNRVYVDMVLEDPRVHYVNSPALMQYVYGQDEELGVDPGGTYPPLFQPLPEGDITYPSPLESMRDYGVTRDCFHLSPEGYFFMIDYQFELFYHTFFMDEFYNIAGVEGLNGNVASDGATSAVIQTGESDGTESLAILTFETLGMASDTTLEKVSIFLRRDSLTGINPIGSTVQLRMKSGHFGANPEIEADDFTDEGDLMAEACVFGTNDASGDWLRIDLPSSFYSSINADAVYQFAVYSEDASAGELFFTGVEEEAFAPVLNVKYMQDASSVDELGQEGPEVIVYPNPVQHTLNFYSSTSKITGASIFSMEGKLIFSGDVNDNALNIQTISPGQYYVQIITDKGVATRAFVKK